MGSMDAKSANDYGTSEIIVGANTNADAAMYQSSYQVGDELMFLDPKEHVGGRLSSTIALVRNDLGQGIQGKNMLDDILCLPRNFLQAGYHVFQAGWPIAADMFATTKQEYHVTQRRGPLHGTANSVRKVVESEGVFRKASAILSEPLDGPADDLWYAATGGSQWIIEPMSSSPQEVKPSIAQQQASKVTPMENPLKPIRRNIDRVLGRRPRPISSPPAVSV